MAEPVYSEQTLTIAISTAISDVYDNRSGMAAGFITPAALTATTTIGFKVCSSEDGTFLPLYSNAATPVLIASAVTVDAAYAYQIPDAVRFWPYFKIWTHAAGVDVNQAAARTFKVVSLV